MTWQFLHAEDQGMEIIIDTPPHTKKIKHLFKTLVNLKYFAMSTK